MASRLTISLLGLGLGLGLGSPSWFTRLVLQHLFRSQGQENILAAAASSSKQQAATELISAYLHISINIDGKSPKLSWYIVLMMPYNPTQFQVKTHQGAGSVGKKVRKSRKAGKVKPGGGGGTGVGDHFGTIRHISINIDGTSPKLLW